MSLRASAEVSICWRRCVRCYSFRHSNLGQITEYLVKEGVPNLLQTSFEDRYLDEQIRLRFLPTTHPYFPVLQGKTKYKASLNAIRVISNKLILNKDCKLHINSVTTLLRDNKTHRYNCVTENDKLIVKWQSCTPQETFKHSGTQGKVSSVPQNLLTDTAPPVVKYILHPTGKPISKEMISNEEPLVAENNLINRVVKGIFVFEFNEDNSKISVHTFEDVEMIDFNKVETGALAC
ncbi:hypothetical protein HG537_0E01130 [Torulaspora globosa]|uniref:Uncharacterized protein n=1 Tax=Torulaspora globosa TaxID=48254 RepID=A0A7H9HSQ0_9SACH|nr:hypothetical protein HG537_0E01130 [Torulaspora sp. CBS 2947]